MPANILWFDDNSSVQVIDCRLARMTNNYGSSSSYSYMAPELHIPQSKKILDSCIQFQDMWSFGATLLDCIIGCRIIDDNEIFNENWTVECFLNEKFSECHERKVKWLSIDLSIRETIISCLNYDYTLYFIL